MTAAIHDTNFYTNLKYFHCQRKPTTLHDTNHAIFIEFGFIIRFIIGLLLFIFYIDIGTFVVYHVDIYQRVIIVFLIQNTYMLSKNIRAHNERMLAAQ